jgi:hypothetical protein
MSRKSVFHPDYAARRLTDVSAEALLARGIRGVILDIDNTTAPWGEAAADNAAVQWIRHARSIGLKLVFLSNSTDRRVRALSEALSVPCVTGGKKPLPGFFRRAVRELGLPADEAAMVGDTVITDIFGANRLGLTTILVEPLTPRDFMGTKIYRWIERLFGLRKPKNEGEKWPT